MHRQMTMAGSLKVVGEWGHGGDEESGGKKHSGGWLNMAGAIKVMEMMSKVAMVTW